MTTSPAIAKIKATVATLPTAQAFADRARMRFLRGCIRNIPKAGAALGFEVVQLPNPRDPHGGTEFYVTNAKRTELHEGEGDHLSAWLAWAAHPDYDLFSGDQLDELAALEFQYDR